MTFSRRTEIVETPEGIGQVCREGEAIAKVGYSLRVERENVFARSFAGKEKYLMSRKFISGTISVLEGDIVPTNGSPAPEGRLTLFMQDKREVDFYVVELDPLGGEHIIRGIGNFRQIAR